MRSALDRSLAQSITGLFWAVALLVLGYLDVSAQSRIGFPANQFGKAELALPQSSTTAELETLFNAHADNFELVKSFSAPHPIKRLSKWIGRLDLLVNGREGGQWVEVCTGTLIDEDHVLTAHHCFLSEDGTPLNISAARFRLGYYGGPDGEGRDFQAQLPAVEARGNEKLDFAILKVAGSPGRGIGRAPLSRDIPSPGEELLILHHPLGKPMRATRRFCRMLSTGHVTSSDFRHRCDTLGGSSGAPVFTDVNENKKLIGVHYKGGLDETHESSNSGILFTAIARNSDLLKRLLGAQLSPVRPSPPERGTPDITAQNTSQYIGNNTWAWTIFIDASPDVISKIDCVEYTLHETFRLPPQTVCRPDTRFAFNARGWGPFNIPIRVIFKDGTTMEINYMLKFQ